MIEVSVTRVHAAEDILVPGHDTHIDPDRWRPLVMSFCEFYGLAGKLHPSRLATAYAPGAEGGSSVREAPIAAVRVALKV
jgi:hypothetical protein